MYNNKVSSRYAKALMSNASELNIIDDVFRDLAFVNDVISKSNELKSVVFSPIIQSRIKNKIFETIFIGKVTELTLRFLILLNDKGRENLILQISDEFTKLYNSLNNRLPVTITTSKQLNEKLSGEIVSKISNWSKKTVLPDFQVEPLLIGGITVRIEDWVYDASIKNQLDVLRDTLITGGENFGK